MLQHLVIKNYALINELSLKPSDNLNIITGETGAGKSILLGALGILLGDRVDKKLILKAQKKCIIEGVFNVEKYDLKKFFESNNLDYDPQTIIRREVTLNGVSRAFINDTPVQLTTLKKLGKNLVDIHSQHDTLNIVDPNFILNWIDICGDLSSIKKKYDRVYKEFILLNNSYKSLKEKQLQNEKELDYSQYILDELSAIQFIPNEQPQLEEKLHYLDNITIIKGSLSEIIQIMDNDENGLLSLFRRVKQQLTKLSNLSLKFKQLAERVTSCEIELKDIYEALNIENNNSYIDQNEVANLRERLDMIYRLQKKHQVNSIEQLLLIKGKLQQKIKSIDNADNDLKIIKNKLMDARMTLNDLGKKLSLERSKCLPNITEALVKQLKLLGFPHIQIKFEQTNDHSFQETGIDQIKLYFSANKGTSLIAINAASGGELSRFMLCLKYLMAEKVALPTIVVDEIDKGVSGEMAKKIANMLKKMSDNHQVIVITHLPQVAAKGAHHYKVFKDHTTSPTSTKIKLLKQSEREKELAEMVSGNQVSSAALEHAKELLNV